MKPQGSKDTAHSSSQTPEGACAKESLENLSANLEKFSLEKEKNIPFSHEELENIIADLERDLADGSWVRDNPHYVKSDLKMMPALVNKANHKHPGMNLKLAMTPEELSLSIKEAIDAGIQSSRYIVGIKDGGLHFAVLDHRTIGNQTSLILFEPANIDAVMSSLLAIRTQIAIQKQQLPHCHSSTVEMNIQESHTECGIFSLALAKKLHTESDKLTRMHQDNISGVLCTPDTPLPSDKVDPYLPPKFYKHTQGTRRLREYVRSNPEAEHKKVNKKDETLLERFERNLVETEGKAVSVSLHRKRVSEYKSLTM
ncbi:YopJ/AvrA family T3SS effector serine/threonine acetyltransferase [Bartonella taylorii]|uniref:YopJ/AvrA family T3SS effector serine/threonine acetyltransferase n=1 Tax=Bartonella taylorii TaxID=33046 RepID=UPI001ABADF04|nr:YopJ/AvrA family T3SS effector serine/threonine acetyltransferase [Bartonella taylorii]